MALEYITNKAVSLGASGIHITIHGGMSGATIQFYEKRGFDAITRNHQGKPTVMARTVQVPHSRSYNSPARPLALRREIPPMTLSIL